MHANIIKVVRDPFPKMSKVHNTKKEKAPQTKWWPFVSSFSFTGD